MKYQPKHMRDEHGHDCKKSKHTDVSEAMRTDEIDSTKFDSERREAGATAHPLGIPVPDPGDEGEYVPIPGKGSIDHIAPNGAVIRNPWSEQPEIKPDYAYTDEQEDQNLLIM